MSVQKLAGLETEYAVVGDERVRASREVVRAYPRIALGPGEPAGHNPHFASVADSDLMLPNGARFYVDHAHPEYSTPECLDPLTLTMADRAGAEIMRRCAQAANEARPGGERIRLYKNNSDHRGNTYGCHENYLLDAETYEELFGNKMHWLYTYLVPFLVSRIVFTGSGKVGSENGAGPVAYQISQRADFFERVVGPQTTFMRPLVNTRDEPHADALRYRRLHVIAGDANMCPFASWLKVGTMQLMLRMLEDGALSSALVLADPLAAVTDISHDPTCRRTVRLEDGRFRTAVEIQLEFLAHAERYFARQTPNEAEGAVLAAWRETLLALQDDPGRLAGCLDWVTKLQVLNQLLGRDQWGMQSPQAHEVDIKYHALDPDESIYQLLERLGLIKFPPGWDPAAVERYLCEPPDETRAYLRGKCIERYAPQIVTADWEELSFDGGRLSMCDPFGSNRNAVEAVLDATTSPSQMLVLLDAMSAEAT